MPLDLIVDILPSEAFSATPKLSRELEMWQLDAKTILVEFMSLVKHKKITFLDSDDRKTILDDAKALQEEINEDGSRNNETEQLRLAKELWNRLITSALSHIATTPVLRGLGELKKYYDKSVDFENLLFGIEETYRDHTMHSLWVYLLGQCMLHGHHFPKIAPIDWDWGVVIAGDGKNDGPDSHSHQDRNREKTKDVRNALLGRLEPYRDSVYCIMALCHDLAYPFEKAERVNQRLEGIAEFLGITSFERLRYTFSLEQGILISELLGLMSARAVISKDCAIRVVKDDPTFVDMTHSLEKRKHGILSAYLLYRLLDTMGEITFSDVHLLPESEKGEVIKHLLLRKSILHSMASHTCDYAFSDHYNCFRFLLSFVDELEEFSRHTRRGRESFDQICDASLDIQEKGHFVVEYTFTKDSADARMFFIDRARRFCRMVHIINSSEEPCSIREVKMTCTDKRSRPFLKYELTINADGVRCSGLGGGDPWITPDPEEWLTQRAEDGKEYFKSAAKKKSKKKSKSASK